MKVNVRRCGKYKITVTDEDNQNYYFECYYDDSQKTIILKGI